MIIIEKTRLLMACFFKTVFSQKVLHKNEPLRLTKNRPLLFDNERYPYLVHLIYLKILFRYPVRFLASKALRFLTYIGQLSFF